MDCSHISFFTAVLITLHTHYITVTILLCSEFNRKFQQTIDDRRANETDVERAHRAKATEDLQQWQLQRQTRLGAKKEKNRSEEQVLLESIESEVEASNSWDRVTKLVDLATEPSTDNKKADTTRMKKLLIQLKNEPLPAKNN